MVLLALPYLCLYATKDCACLGYKTKSSMCERVWLDRQKKEKERKLEHVTLKWNNTWVVDERWGLAHERQSWT